MSMFQQPSQGDQVKIPELLGALVLIYVRELRTGITTPYGEKEAIACDLHVLDGPKAGEISDNALIFQGALIGALRGATGGDPVLGRIGQGTAKNGQSPPYILLPFTDADAAVATAWIQAQTQRHVQQPAPAAAPAVPTPAAAAPAPAAASPSPAAASPATANVPAALPNGMTAEAFLALPAEVQELIRQSVAA